MTDIKDFFIASNTVRNAPDYDSNVLSTLVQTVEAFARVTYQSVYLIDYYRQEFLYMIIGNRQVTYSRMLYDCVMQSSTQPRFMQT